MARRVPSPHHGVLVVDKPKGPTSHDVVRWVRRALQTRAVGHAGTLDPMATGVLVVAVGEATKLVPYLTAADKTYVTRIALGAETDTLDAEGQVVATAPPPALDVAAWQALAETFVGEHAQQVPKVSAVRVDGERLHVRTRRGEDVQPPSRDVVLHEVRVLDASDASLSVHLRSGKGFFVRSFARDLAKRGGTLAHLTALRREQSGRFDLGGAVGHALLERAGEGDAQARAQVATQLMSLRQACARLMEVRALDADGERDAFHGRPIALTSVEGELPAVGAMLCLTSSSGRALAVARRDEAALQVVRGFRTPDAEPAALV